ncbi:MAG: glutamine amidotransferase [Spirochaetota bacterium]
MMGKKVIYFGDTSLDTAASYLAGIMNYYHITYIYIPSNEQCNDHILTQPEIGLIVLSDYPSSNFTSKQFKLITSLVADGTGLLMIGGWESFTGLNGGYNSTPLADILPVVMSDQDDRVNWPYPCIICKVCDHEILDNLPFKSPPGIGGFNKVTVKDDGHVLLNCIRYTTGTTPLEEGTVSESGNCVFAAVDVNPLLVVGFYGQGRTAAFASDVAPHWASGLVDWGLPRIRLMSGLSVVEVGCHYASLFRNLMLWTAGLHL